MKSYNVENFKDVISAFPFNGNIVDVISTDTGLINNTFILTFSDGNIDCKYILQQINTNVFKNPDELMSNIMNVTSFLRNKIILEGRNFNRETLTFLYTKDNLPYYRDSEDNYWRTYRYIDNCYTCDNIDEPSKAYDSGKAFGHFQKLLSDYPIENLFETIPDFHNTPVRFENFKKSIENNISGRLKFAEPEISFALERYEDSHKLTDLIKSGDLRLKVTHNDTKINNVLFDSITNEAFCVIDLDTVMPGLLLYDFGDSIRSGATTANEDEQDLSKYNLDLNLFNSYAEGFITEAASTISPIELENLAFSAKLMTLECGIRFLSDYLNGDTYFKTEYPNHNLVRCRTQFKLVKQIEENMDKMNEFTNEVYRRVMSES